VAAVGSSLFPIEWHKSIYVLYYLVPVPVQDASHTKVILKKLVTPTSQSGHFGFTPKCMRH
jgi:hypothetical protein